MSKFVADKISKMTDEDGNTIVTFVVSGYQRRLAEMTIAECKGLEQIAVEAKKYRKNRSLDQNAMLWACLTKLAIATCGSKSKEVVDEMYCAMLEEANVAYDFLAALPETEPMLKKTFRVVRKRGTVIVNGKR